MQSARVHIIHSFIKSTINATIFNIKLFPMLHDHTCIDNNLIICHHSKYYFFFVKLLWTWGLWQRCNTVGIGSLLIYFGFNFVLFIYYINVELVKHKEISFRVIEILTALLVNSLGSSATEFSKRFIRHAPEWIMNSVGK